MKTFLRIAICILIFQAAAAFPAPQTFQVTIGASATQLSITTLNCRWFIVQNNAAHAARLGDSGTTSSKGTSLPATPSSPFQSPMVQPGGVWNLSQWYVAGTQNDVIDVTCDTVNY